MKPLMTTTLICCAAAALGAAHAALAQELLVSNFGSSTITRYDMNTRQLIATHGAGSGLVNPLAARVGPDGKLYVTSEGSNAILRFNANTGAFIDTFVAAGAGGLTQPSGLDWGPDGNLYVASFDGNRVLRYHGATGAFLSTFITTGLGGLNGADNGMIFGPDGHLYIPSYFGSRVLRYNGATGAFMGNFMTVSRPRVLVFRENDILVTSETQGIRRHNKSTGAFLSTFALAGTNGLSTPIGLAIGPDGSVYAATGGNSRVLKYSGAGTFQQTFLNAAAGVNLPVYLTVIVPAAGTAGPLACLAVLCARRRRR